MMPKVGSSASFVFNDSKSGRSGIGIPLFVIGHILSFELKIQERIRSQKENKWKPVSSGQMSGKTAGIMGTGSIGSALATALSQLGVEVLGFNSSGKQNLPFKKVYSDDLLNEFLANSDYLIGVLPDLSTTTDLINASTLKELKETALFINVGRGNLVDEEALSASLRSKELAGAVLDVTKKEPLPVDSELWAAPNLTLTAHTAAESRPRDIVNLFLRNLEHFIEGEALEGVRLLRRPLHLVRFLRAVGVARPALHAEMLCGRGQ